MEWKFDTGSVGAVPAAGLRKVLEDARDHWIESQAKAVSESIFHVATGNMEKPGAVKPDLGAVAEKAKKAESDHRAKSASMKDHFAKAIDAACTLATLAGPEALVTATVCGHDDEAHPSHCAKRFGVTVDQVG